ncbi:MAG: FecR family protein [Opitutaceae bacterium]
MTAAASLVFILGLSAAWSWRRHAPSLPSPVIVAAPTTQILPDGTVVEFRGTAQISLDFSPTLRRVILKQGEAYFQVAPNRERPFVVAVNGVQVRAVGTAFSVEFNVAAVEVLVTEGRVEIEHPASAEIGSTSSPPKLVDAGSSITLAHRSPARAGNAPPPQIRNVSTAEVNERLAWRVPRIEFSSTPLSEALIWFNRYSRVRLVLDDPAMGSLQLSGVLRPDNPDSLLRILRNDFGIEAEEQGDKKIVLRRQ